MEVKLKRLAQQRIHLYEKNIQDYRQRSEGLRRLFIDYLIGNLPDTDMNIDQETLSDFVEHSLWLYEQKRWGEIPLDIFLNFVLHPRCSKEKVEACRRFFYQEVEELQDDDLVRTILDVNYWCAAHVRYQLTDPRTKSAKFSYLSGSGRCGEKATFLVQVYRSLGIPARSTYVPMWSHTDDNHAWVEVYIDGTWQYLGAGEGEEFLEKAWFSLATTRAPYLLSNAATFFDEGLKTIGDRTRLWKVIDHTAHYTETKTVHVQLKELPSLEEMQVVVLNYASFRPINTIFFEEGKACFEFGRGDCFLKAYVDGQLLLKHVAENETKVIISPLDFIDTKTQFEQNPGKVGKVKKFPETKSMQEDKLKWRDEAKKAYAKKIERVQKEGMNHKAHAKLDQALAEDAERLRNVMASKDLLDFDADIYIEHFQHVQQFRKSYPEKIFFEYLATPRVHWEELTSYAPLFYERFKNRKDWIENPRLIYQWAANFLHSGSNYAIQNTYMPVNRILDYPYGTEMDLNIFVVAIARSLGIPSRYHQQKDNIEYYDGEKFVSFTSSKPRHLLRIYGDLEAVKVSVNPVPEPASFSENSIEANKEGYFEDDYIEGSYEIIASKRLPSGKQVGSIEVIKLDRNMSVEVKDFNIELEDVVENVDISDLLNQLGIHEQKGILVVGKAIEEPTAHVLNELIEQKDFIQDYNIPVLYVEKDSGNYPELLKRAHENLPSFKILTTFDEHLEEALVRRVFREPKDYPFTCVFKGGLSQMSTSGYQVNTINNPWIPLILK